jgi:hypothetical protein
MQIMYSEIFCVPFNSSVFNLQYFYIAKTEFDKILNSKLTLNHITGNFGAQHVIFESCPFHVLKFSKFQQLIGAEVVNYTFCQAYESIRYVFLTYSA